MKLRWIVKLDMQVINLKAVVDAAMVAYPTFNDDIANVMNTESK